MSDELDLTNDTTTISQPVEVEATTEPVEPTLRPEPAPVASTERFASIDVVRGFALCGILVMNIMSFGLPEAAYMNPTVGGGFSGLNFIQWVIAALIFDGKMMSTFSMLFGAGMVIMTDRTEARGGSPAAFFYRRAGILLVFGMLHGYLLWMGDILYSYAICGMIVYLFRNRGPRILVMLGIIFLTVGLLTNQGMAWYSKEGTAATERVEAAKAVGTTPSARDKGFADSWKETREMFEPTPKEVAEDIEIHRQGSYVDILKRAISEHLCDGVLYISHVLGMGHYGADARWDGFAQARSVHGEAFARLLHGPDALWVRFRPAPRRLWGMEPCHAQFQ